MVVWPIIYIQLLPDLDFGHLNLYLFPQEKKIQPITTFSSFLIIPQSKQVSGMFSILSSSF